jgi:uridylate kinase
MKLIFALGGSVVVPVDKVDTAYAKEFAAMIKELSKKNTIGIVVGGGKTARKAIEKVRAAGGNQAECDYAGIDASRENAAAVGKIIGLKQSKIPENFKEAREILDKNGIVIMGGTEPGHSTDAVAMILGEYCNADLILNLTNVAGIYDKDPKANRDAKMLKEISAAKLEQMVAGILQHAGKYELLDLVAVKILQRSGIRCISLNGRDLENVRNAVEGRDFVGTAIN